jgi:hypothetical protein
MEASRYYVFLCLVMIIHRGRVIIERQEKSPESHSWIVRIAKTTLIQAGIIICLCRHIILILLCQRSVSSSSATMSKRKNIFYALFCYPSSEGSLRVLMQGCKQVFQNSGGKAGQTCPGKEREASNVRVLPA